MIAAIEDAISSAVIGKLLSDLRPDLTVFTTIGLKGNVYLRSKARDLNRTANHVPVFLITDLDDPNDCAPSLIDSWLGSRLAPKMLFRVAVMEIESWLLADRSRMATLLGIPEEKIPINTDTVRKPKELIVELARHSRLKTIRTELVPAQGSTAAVGPAFNSRMVEFVGARWRPAEAVKCSPSLARCTRRLSSFCRP
jgi:hypothetical protein